MQRYTVTIVSPGTSTERPVLLVPFEPSALVTAFVDELYMRISRRGLNIGPNTHIATLHLDSESGALIDCEDILSDVVLDPKTESVVAVFTRKAASEGLQAPEVPALHGSDMAPSLSFRIVTPATAKNRSSCPVIRMPTSSTIRQLHEKVANQLGVSPQFDESSDNHECNCSLANKLASAPSQENSFFVVHGKSVVERLHLDHMTETSVKAALRQRFGLDFENTKRSALVGAEMHPSLASIYKKNPVAAICSKKRHTPLHARVEIDDADQKRSSILDIHTSELPIHPSCLEVTLDDAGLTDLAVDGVVDIFTVNRRTTGDNAASIGKSNIYRSRAHWEPPIAQSDRGMAMFLSTLRVFASLVQDMRHDERAQDAVLHAFDLLTQFPPALRTLHILIQGKTPSAVESATLAQAMYEVLDSFMCKFTAMIGSDHTRVFEGARLFFGFVLEKGRTLKLSAGVNTLPYLDSLVNLAIRDYRTNEPVMRAVQTAAGLVERDLYDSFQEGHVLADSNLQTYMVKTDVSNSVSRAALLSGGTAAEIVVFSSKDMMGNYRYPDHGVLQSGIDTGELSELSHLAELCGRNKLAVHRPSQLASAVAPCLTFDRNAHLSVYTGEQPCGEPGHSSILFRPKHGEATIDAAVIEQVMAPLLATYEADGTAVFDALGGAAVRRLQTPDEILMVCVDCSASMRGHTDFAEVNDADDYRDHRAEPDASSLIAVEMYSRASFDEVKESLNAYEGIDDMLAIIKEHNNAHRLSATQVLTILRLLLSESIIKKSESLTNRRSHGHRHYHVRQQIAQQEADLNKLKLFFAGLKTHEAAVLDFLVYRAVSTPHDLSLKWTWTLGEEAPKLAGANNHLPTVPDDIVEIPNHLKCPISQNLLLDAVTGEDNHTYSNSAISTWLRINSNSPMTRQVMTEAALVSNQAVCDEAQSWMNGDGIIVVGEGSTGNRLTKRFRAKELDVTFDSRVGSFTRTISKTTSLKDLYRLAFRGLKAKYLVFQLSTDRYGPLSPSPEATVSSRNINDGDHITIRIAEDEPSSGAATGYASADQVLVKVYRSSDSLLFGFWVKKNTAQSLATIVWKYWRDTLRKKVHTIVGAKQIWTGLTSSGDNLLTGQPRDSTERLSTLLNRVHCFGHLGSEKVYREENVAVDFAGPLVLKVEINHPYHPKEERGVLTRLDVLKQMFEALINRNLAYGYKTHVGLITFATKPAMKMGISHVLENFRRSVSDMEAEGDTALFDGLALADDQLSEKGKVYPEAKKRIVVISDGEDTKSTNNTAADISWRLREAGIVVDSVSLGDGHNTDLRAISYVTGGYRFHPTTLTNALAICELEPFLSLTERPPVAPPALSGGHSRPVFMGTFWQEKLKASFTIANEFNFPPRKVHPNIADEFVQLQAMTTRSGPVSNTGIASRSNLRTTRLMSEMRSIASSAHPKYDVYVSETDMSFWKVVMSGADGSPYEKGTFLLYLHADEGYPTFAPKARFITRIKHPNVNTHGRICHSIFDRDWTSDISMATLLDSVYGLLLQPEHSDPVNTTTTLGFHHDQVEFAEEVREHVRGYGRRSRLWWKNELLGEEHIDDGDSGSMDGDYEDDEEMDGLEDEYDDEEDLDELDDGRDIDSDHEIPGVGGD